LAEIKREFDKKKKAEAVLKEPDRREDRKVPYRIRHFEHKAR